MAVALAGEQSPTSTYGCQRWHRESHSVTSRTGTGDVWHCTDTTVSSQRDHVETEGDRAEVETVGESSDVSEGAREGRTGCSAANEEGTEERDV